MKLGNLQMGIYSHNRLWYRYFIPRRQTLKKPDRPVIYKWLCFYIGYDTKAYREYLAGKNL